jgi:hypothetical protein
MTAAQAIAESIITNAVVILPWSKRTFDALVARGGSYERTHWSTLHGEFREGYQFDGGDECARDQWTVIVTAPKKR